MALKHFVVRQGFKKELVFLILEEQELRLRSAIKDSSPASKIKSSKLIAVDEIALEAQRVLDDGGVLAISSQVVALKLPQVAALACEAHLQGARIIGFEAALSELKAHVETEPDQLVKTFMHGAAHQGRAVRTYSVIKNFAEPLVALFLLLLLSPALMAVSILVKLTSPGPVFYRQTRVGYRGRTFDIIKFRSMRLDAEKDGPVWASAREGDARLTPVGELLRATHLDELPQLWNVVRGELSFIGPRPERPVFTDRLLEEIPLFSLRTLVRPGITGWAQVCQGYANSVEDSRTKLELDFYYILRHSPILDLQVVLRTLGVVTSGGTEAKKRHRHLTPIAGFTGLPLKSFARMRSLKRRASLPVHQMPVSQMQAAQINEASRSVELGS